MQKELSDLAFTHASCQIKGAGVQPRAAASALGWCNVAATRYLHPEN